MATASVDAYQSMRDCIELHLSRSHTTYTAKTVYSHVNLAILVETALPDWTVVTPGEPVEVLPDVPSQYPEPQELAPEALCAFLLKQRVEREVVSELDLVDKVNGHCETAAASFSEQVIAALRRGSSHEKALRTTFDKMVKALKSSDIDQQVAMLFEPEARLLKSDELLWEIGGRAMWGPLLPDVDGLPGPRDWLISLTAGATEQLPTLLRQIAEHRPADDSPGSDGRFAVPLYVVNYVWATDELTQEQMKEWDCETACYSVHAIGLVFDQRAKAVLMADPNGPLLMGGGMEFLCVPHAKLPLDCEASTCVSQFNPEHPPAESKKGGKKKRKRQ